MNRRWNSLGNKVYHNSGPQSRSYVIKGEDEGVYRRNRYHILQDKTKDRGPQWSGTIEVLYTGESWDSTEVDKVLIDSNYLLQVPVIQPKCT